MSDSDNRETGPDSPNSPEGADRGWETGGSVFDRSKTGSGAAATGGGAGSGEQALLPAGTSRGTDRAKTAPVPAFVGPYATILAREEHPDREEVDRRSYRRGVRLVTFWFALAGVAAVAFIVLNFAGDVHKEYYTPVLGICIGVAMAGLGFGLVVWNKRLMPDEEAVQERHPLHSSPDDVVAFEEDFARGYQETGVGRHKVLRRTLLAAAGLLGLAPLAMIFNLGPIPHGELQVTRWTRGARLATRDGVALRLGDLPIGGIATVYPAIPDQNGKFVALTDNQTAADSTVMLIRLRPGEDQPVPGRETWSVEGHVAYSKICTHAGCPVGLYERTTQHLLCPCHQSTFLVTQHCLPIFGPAARPLPQLPIAVDADGYFIAQSDFTEPVGPSWWSRT